MADVKSIVSDREFQAFPDLQSLSDTELREIYLRGDNLHITTSRASAAKRLLDIRSEQKQIKTLEHIEVETKKLREIVAILTFFQKRFLPNKPLWVRVLAFLGGTVFVGILLNLAATYISLFWFNWR